MEQLKSMKSCLVAQAQAQMGNLQQVDAKELGEVIDMIKDLEEAIYYCNIVEAMEEKDKQQPTNTYYYTEKMMYPEPDYYRDMDRQSGRMYYSSGSNGGNSGNNSGNSSSSNSGNNSSRYYTEREYPLELRDRREGRSPMSRRMYMESKELHQDKATKMKELEKYMQELTQDVTEMIEDATPEEKQLLHKKVTALASKIEQMN